MDTNDFLGSFAQENVSFSTQIVRSARVGDNYWTTMVFVESDRFVSATTENGWEDAPGLPSCKVLVVTADTYAQFTSGLLASWLYDLFCNGFTGNCILVAPGKMQMDDVKKYVPIDGWVEGCFKLNEDGETYEPAEESEPGVQYYEEVTTPGFIVAMEEAYEVLKPYAYHKTICAGGQTSVNAEYAVALAKKCMADDYLSAAPCLPQTDPDLNAEGTLYRPLKDANADAFMGWHSDKTRNAALYSLGLALSAYNGSGTQIGNGMDMTASANITASNDGMNPTVGQKSVLKGAYVQYFKTIGDNTGNVAAETDKTINGKVYAAYWILGYVTYMCKVRVAQMLTQRNFYKNAFNYGQIVSTMENIVKRFEGAGLTNIVISAPSYGALPEAADDELIIPNAWSAQYVNHLRKVTISGTLYIGS